MSSLNSLMKLNSNDTPYLHSDDHNRFLSKEKPYSENIDARQDENAGSTENQSSKASLPPRFTLNAPKDAPDAVKALVTLDNRPEYALELIDNQGVFTVEMPLEKARMNSR